MITDHIRNAALYTQQYAGLGAGFAFIQAFQAQTQPDGRYELSQDGYAVVQTYKTAAADDKLWESHEKYLDLQYVVQGKELISCADVKTMHVHSAYDAETDSTLYDGQGRTNVGLSDGYFAVFFPDDAHKPGCDWEKTHAVRKIVVKIKI